MAFLLEPYPEDVLARVRHDYPPHEVDSVMTILSAIRDLGWHIPWLQLACLRLADGEKRLVQQWIDDANSDPRNLKLFVERLHGPDWERHYILYSARQN